MIEIEHGKIGRLPVWLGSVEDPTAGVVIPDGSANVRVMHQADRFFVTLPEAKVLAVTGADGVDAGWYQCIIPAEYTSRLGTFVLRVIADGCVEWRDFIKVVMPATDVADVARSVAGMLRIEHPVVIVEEE